MTYSLESLGFSLSSVPTRDGTKINRLETPFRLAGEFPFDIFLEETPAGIHVSDEGLTYHNLLSLGLDAGQGCLWKALRSLVEKEAGVTLSDQGRIEAFGPVATASEVVARYIAALIRVDRWVHASFAHPRDVVNREHVARRSFASRVDLSSSSVRR